MGFIIFILVLISMCLLLLVLETPLKKLKIKKQIEQLANNTLELSPEEFFKIRNKTFNSKEKYALRFNFDGVYILHNLTKKIYYVGQGKKLLDRVNNHFTGRGNGDIYADYKRGNKFTIKMLSLKNSGYKTLNELERVYIEKYNSYKNGYNKTKGNK